MEARRARTVANVAIALAGAAAAYAVLTKPPLRRLALAGLRTWLGASIPIFVMNQVREAWVQSGHAASVRSGA